MATTDSTYMTPTGWLHCAWPKAQQQCAASCRHGAWGQNQLGSPRSSSERSQGSQYGRRSELNRDRVEQNQNHATCLICRLTEKLERWRHGLTCFVVIMMEECCTHHVCASHGHSQPQRPRRPSCSVHKGYPMGMTWWRMSRPMATACAFSLDLGVSCFIISRIRMRSVMFVITHALSAPPTESLLTAMQLRHWLYKTEIHIHINSICMYVYLYI